MLQRVEFENFRSFNKIEFSDLRLITLISGKNNAGKSSVLEGIFLNFDHVIPESFVKINQFRGLPVSYEPVYLWEPMFYNLDMQKKLCIVMTFDEQISKLEYVREDSFTPFNRTEVSSDRLGQIVSSSKLDYTLKFKYIYGDYREEGHFIAEPSGLMRNITTTLDNNQIQCMPSIQFINSAIITNNDNAVAEWIGRLELQGKKDKVLRILKIIDPSICDIFTIVTNGQIRLYVRTEKTLLPLKLAGDGLNRLLFIILAMIINRNSMVLIDEIETGFHYSAFPKLWEAIANAAKENNCQLIASTHSYECIAGAVDGIEYANMKDDFCYFRIDRNENNSFVYRYSDELLRTAIAADMEVR